MSEPQTRTKYTYDAENRLINVSGSSAATYVYDAFGRRARKTVASGSIDYFRDLSGRVSSELSNGTTWTASYVYLDSLLAEYTQGTTYFPFQDHLGSTRLVTNPAGGIVDSMDYLPFGEQIAGGSATTHKFTGKELDAESGLDNFGDRYDSSSLGRFMSSDWSNYPEPVPYAELADPQSLNLYSYVRNNPFNTVDDDGHDPNAPNAAGTCGFFCRLINSIFGGSEHPIVTVTIIPVQYPFPPASSVHANPFPMRPGVNYGSNPPGKYLVGGCPGGTCHTLDGLYPPLQRDFNGPAWVLFGLGGIISSTDGVTLSLPDWARNPGGFVNWLRNVSKADVKLTPAEVDAIIEKAKELGVKVRLDPPHLDTPWDVPHLNIGDANVHIEVPQGYDNPGVPKGSN
jgi:RHS repeat-associated protein